MVGQSVETVARHIKVVPIYGWSLFVAASWTFDLHTLAKKMHTVLTTIQQCELHFMTQLILLEIKSINLSSTGTEGRASDS